MSDFQVRCDHQLGRDKALKVAQQWAQHAEKRLEMQCSLQSGEQGDCVVFSRPGVSGEMKVAADHFEITAKLGFLFKAFAGQFEAETRKRLEEAITQAQAKA